MTARPVLLPDLTPGNLDRNGELAERIGALPIEDVIRVFVTAGHVLWHRAPRPPTILDLVAELTAGIEDVHRAGLP